MRRMIGAAASAFLCFGAAAAQDTVDSVAGQAFGASRDSVDALDHVRFAVPPGVQPAPQYGGVCVWRCVVFETNDQGDWGLPFIVVHQPFALSADEMLDAFIAAKERSEDHAVFDTGERRSGQPGDGSTIATQRVWSGASYDTDGDPSIITAIERDGASLIVELHGRVMSDLTEQQQPYTMLATGIGFDGAGVAAEGRRRAEGQASARAAVERGYAEGGKVQLYTRYDVRTLLMPGMDGMATTNVQHDRDTLALLPGGVVLEGTPKDDFRAPDLAAFYGASAPTRWTREGRGYALSRDEGTVQLTEQGDGLQPSDGGGAWRPAARLASSDLVGTYTYGSLNAVSGVGGVMAVGESDGAMNLAADGTYTARRASFGGAFGGVGTASATREATEAGRWAFDPVAYTLTLTPEGGAPLAMPAFRRDTECVDGSCKWMIGETVWDRSGASVPMALGAARAVPADGTASPSAAERERGACGFPIYDPLQRAGQDILAKYDRCDEYTGSKE